MSYPAQGVAIDYSAITGGDVNIQTVETEMDEILSVDRSTQSITTTTDGTEQTIFEDDGNRNVCMMRGWTASLDDMANGDVIVFRVYVKYEYGGAYSKITDDANMTYVNAQSNPATLHFTDPITNVFSIKITMELTAGVNFDVPVEFFIGKRA